MTLSTQVAHAASFVEARGFESGQCYRHLSYLQCSAEDRSKNCTLSVFTLSERQIIFKIARNEVVEGLLKIDTPWSISTFFLPKKKEKVPNNLAVLLKANSIKTQDAFAHQKLEIDFLAQPIKCP